MPGAVVEFGEDTTHAALVLRPDPDRLAEVIRSLGVR